MNLQTLPRSTSKTVLACGAFLKNRACLLDGDQVHWSNMHGDLSDALACEALSDSIDELLTLTNTPISAVVHDLHPDFYSTQLAQAVAARLAVPAVAVQHHHAHIAVALAEHITDAAVIGIALDGVGLGTDGGAWGGEILWVGEGAQWRRIDHLAPLVMPGGDTAAREPWRLSAALLHSVGRADEILARYEAQVGATAARLVQTMLERDLHCPRSTAAGRWFDAAAGALGLSVQQSSEAQAAMALERAGGAWLDAHPSFQFDWPSLDLQPLVLQFFDLSEQGADGVARGAAMFHLGLVSALAQRAIAAAAEHDLDTVVLGGGCFANRILLSRLRRELQRVGLRVLEPELAGYGDAGLALGQAWAAAATDAVGVSHFTLAQV